MKNYGLQVKEIPIIFRGELPAAESPEPGELIGSMTFNFESSDYLQTVPGYYVAYGGSTVEFQPDYLDITINGQLYKNVVKYTLPTKPELAHYGAPMDPNSSLPVFSDDLPFYIAFSRAVSFIFPDGSPREISIDMYSYPEEGVSGEASASNKRVFSCDLTGNGQINHFRARFACGENGTLHLKPYVILNGNIRIDLCNFAQGGDQYIAGDNEEIEFDCYVPIETHAVACVEAENTGEYPSLVDAAMTVQYEDFIESESIVGYEGVNLRRGRR